MPSFPDDEGDFDTLRARVTAALNEQGQRLAAYLLRDGRWKWDEGGAIEVMVPVKKTTLDRTMNADAWKIVREALRETGFAKKMTVVPDVASIKVFISHSSLDQELARSLIELLRAAIPALDHNSIRCTSVPGYKLEGGDSTGPRLREELLQAIVFIGLLTRDSLASSYVLFELGARWGAKTRLKPLRAAGLQPSELRGPLTELHAPSCDDESDLHQMLDEISRELKITLASAYVYVGHLKRLLELSKAQALASNGVSEIRQQTIFLDYPDLRSEG